uniref:Glycosyl transferase, family 14 n=1 Tax=Tanacetum cinerariifolium TaxID=118510 RepID=A0A6L2KEF8_TANCI|nr:glycosyl transferase, family 14 [Tanacetum cinerariifolium]
MNGKYLQNVERFKSPEFKKSEMMKRKVNYGMRRQHLSPDTQVLILAFIKYFVVGFTSDDLDDETVHYTRLHIIAHQSDLVRRRVNRFKVGTVIGVPFAESTIKDVIDFTFYHHYVHDIREEEDAFNHPFAKYRDDAMDKFHLACAGVYFGIDKLLYVFLDNIVDTYKKDHTFDGFLDYLGLLDGPHIITDHQDMVLRLFLDRKEGRYNPRMSSVIPMRKWRKGSQWIALDTRHAKVVAYDDVVFPVFKRLCKVFIYE